MALAVLPATLVHADAPNAPDRIYAALVPEQSCRLVSLDGEGAGKATRTIALLDCAGTGHVALLASGPYPVPNSARPGDYRLLDRRPIAGAGDIQIDLVNGACSQGKRALAHPGVLVARWRDRKSVTGRNIVGLWQMSKDRSKLVPAATKGMTCYRDEE